MKVIKVGAIWCGDCLIMKPRWKKIETENTWLETEYFDFDERKDIVDKYDLANATIPAFIFLDKNGNEITRINGEVSESKLLELINEHKNK